MKIDSMAASGRSIGVNGGMVLKFKAGVGHEFPSLKLQTVLEIDHKKN